MIGFPKDNGILISEIVQYKEDSIMPTLKEIIPINARINVSPENSTPAL